MINDHLSEGSFIRSHLAEQTQLSLQRWDKRHRLYFNGMALNPITDYKVWEKYVFKYQDCSAWINNVGNL